METGSLYPALHRLEAQGWIAASWELSDKGKRAKYYRLTAARAEAACERAFEMEGVFPRHGIGVESGGGAMRRLFRKLGWLARRRSREAELVEELRFHLEEEAEERQAQGLADEEARLAARRELGNITMVQEIHARHVHMGDCWNNWSGSALRRARPC